MIWLLLFWLGCFIYSIYEFRLVFWNNLSWYQKEDIKNDTYQYIRWVIFFLLLFLISPFYVVVSVLEKK